MQTWQSFIALEDLPAKKKDLRLHPTQENAACVEMWRCSAPFSVDFFVLPRSSFTIIAFTREGMIKRKKNCISSAVPERKSWDPCLVYSQQEKERILHPAVTGAERSRFAVLFPPFFSRCTHPVFPLSKVGRLKLPPSCLTKERRPHSLPPDTDGSDELLRRRFDPEALGFFRGFQQRKLASDYNILCVY